MNFSLRSSVVAIMLFPVMLFAQQGAPMNITHAQGEQIDDSITNFMTRWNIRGSQFTLGYKNSIIYSKGYNYADDNGDKVSTMSLFRIASLTKTFTAVGIMQLVEQDQIHLTDKVLDPDLLGDTENILADPRLKKITIDMLLHHLGGWDRDEDGDPTFSPRTVSNIANVPSPPSKEIMIRYILQSMMLEHDPGTKYAYSNIGYLLLGRIIEKKSGLSYEDYIKQHVLNKAGIEDMTIGDSRTAYPNEVHYYDYKFAPSVMSCFDSTQVARPYGGFNMQTMDSFGGWIATSTDLVKYLFFLQSKDNGPFIKPETLAILLTPDPHSEDYAMGIEVKNGNWSHNGSLPGTTSQFLHTGKGFDCAILFNSRPKEDKTSKEEKTMSKQMKELLEHIVANLKNN